MLVAIDARSSPRSTGSAVALQGKNSVKSNDIAPGAVKGKDIARAAVKPADLDLVKVDGEAGPLPTASVPAIDLGGPSVTVNVPGDRTGRDLRARHRRRSTAAATTRPPRSTCSSRRCCRARRGMPRVRLGDAASCGSRPRARGDRRRHRGARPRGGWIVFPANTGQVHVLAALQRRRRRHRDVHEHRHLGRGRRLDRGREESWG